jgi:hypothetical protein
VRSVVLRDYQLQIIAHVLSSDGGAGRFSPIHAPKLFRYSKSFGEQRCQLLADGVGGGEEGRKNFVSNALA